MDDQQQQVCVQPDYGDPAPQVCAPAPQVCTQPGDAPGPAPGDATNPVLAPLPPAAPPDAGGGSPDAGAGPSDAGTGGDASFGGPNTGGDAPEDDAPSSPTTSAGHSMVWDGLTMLPGMSAVATGIDLIKAAGNGIMGDGEDAKKDLSDAALDSLGMLPGAGTALSAEELAWDSHAGAERAGGASADESPTFSEAFYKGLPSWKDITSPFTDPDSWTPQGPSQ